MNLQILCKRRIKCLGRTELGFYDEKFAENETKQIKDLKNYIKNWNSDKNLVLITHFVVISSILNTGSSSGEIIISDKNFNIIGSIDMM